MRGSASKPVREARRRLADAERGYRERVRNSNAALRAAEKAHDHRVEHARKELTKTRRAHDHAVTEAYKSVEHARTGTLITSLGAVRLYDNRLDGPDGTVSLSPNIRAMVEATGVKTGNADTRETVLLLDTPAFDSLVRVQPDSTTTAREVAAKINTAAKNAPTLIAKYEARLREAEENARRIAADVGSIRAAETAVTNAQADTEDVEQAREAAAAAERDDLDLRRAHAALVALDPSANIAPVRLSSETRWARSRRWWSTRRRITKAAILVGVVVLLLFVIGALAGNPNPQTVPHADPVAGQTPSVSISLVSPNGRLAHTEKSRYVLRGDVTPGATVTAAGHPVRVAGGHFSLKVPLKLGQNRITLRARHAGAMDATSVQIIRSKPAVALELDAYDALVVRQPVFALRGRTTPGARVKINGVPVVVSGGRFSKSVTLQPGRNTFYVRADRAGMRSVRERFALVRKLSRAEIEVELQRKRDAFISSTSTIPYNQLVKSPASYLGRRVRYYGQILQIQEDVGGGGFMLLYVTDLGYDVWSDQIWVDYSGRVRGAQGDKLTVYGVVLGAKTYETQIGGQTTVPEIAAKYISE